MMADPSTPSNLMTFWLLARPLNRTSFQVPVPAFCEPGACSISCDIWRPLTGSSLISRSLTLTPMRAELRSTALTLAVTCTVSVTPAAVQRQVQRELLGGHELQPGEFERRQLAELGARIV